MGYEFVRVYSEDEESFVTQQTPVVIGVRFCDPFRFR